MNGCSGTDVAASGLQIKSTMNGDDFFAYTNAQGEYSMINILPGNNVVSISDGLYEGFSVVAPATHEFEVIGNSNEFTADFCVSTSSPVNDAEIFIIPTSVARPGFPASYSVGIRNKGTAILSGSVSLSYISTRMTFTGSNPAIAGQSEGAINFNFSGLLPFQSTLYEVEFLISVPPINNSGDVLTFTGVVTPAQQDGFMDDNSTVLQQTVVNSYDPNDITVHQGEYIFPSQVNDYLHYTIRFQNVGTAEAVNIRVENTLSEYLDWNTLSILAASANYQAQRQNGLLTFRFDNINLPGADNEPESHGFITYKIKPLQPFENAILNSAEIYFDFNEAIYTNIVSTSVQNLGTAGIGVKQLKIYPNPASATISIECPAGIQNGNVEVYDLQGKLILFEEVQPVEGVGIVDLSKIENGLYLIRLSSEMHWQTAKLIKR